MFRGVALALVVRERFALSLVTLILAAWPLEGVAWAGDPLARAKQAVHASDYLTARTELVAARDAGECDPDDAVQLYQLSGIVEAALGDTEAATDAFTRMLSLSPSAALPSGTAPKITRLLETARLSFLGSSPLELRIETRSQPPTITLVVVSDPVHMVTAVRVVFTVDGGPERAVQAPASPRTDVVLAAGARIAARVAALDEHGNRLVEIGSAEAPIEIRAAPQPLAVRAPAPIAPRAPPARRSIFLRWWPYGAATVLSGGATAYFGWSAYRAALDLRRARTASEARAIDERGRRDTRWTNIGFGVTAAFALATGVMYMLEPPRRGETRVTAALVPGGGAMALGGSW